MNKENFLYEQKLAGLFLEGKYSDIINKKIGLPKQISDDLESKYGKYSIWFSNVFFDVLENEYEFEKKDSKANIKDLINNENENFLDFLNKKYVARKTSFDYILDWIKGRNSGAVVEVDKIDFKNLSFKEALERSVEWHRELSKVASGTIEDEQGDIVMTFPDGYYWINLNSKNCDDEAEAMGHCGRGGGNLYSLRKNKKPVVTADINYDGIVMQMRGKANTKPKEEYSHYILDFILSNLIKHFRYNSYNSEDNFYITDLKEKDINKVLQKKPILFKNQKLDLLKDYQIYELLKVKPEIFPINKYFKGNLNIEEMKGEVSNFLINLDNNIDLKDFIQKIKSSGKIFEDVFTNSIKNEDLLIKLIKNSISKPGRGVKLLIKTLLNNFPTLIDYIKELFLKNKELSNLFMNNSVNILEFIEIICLKSFFENEGLTMAKKIFQNPKIKSKIINDYDKEFYEVTMQIIMKNIN